MSEIAQSAGRVARSPAFKLFVISFLVLLLLIPLLIVGGLVSERESRSREVTADVARTWGGVQQLTGPYLVVPYTARIETRDGDKIVQQTQERRAAFLPDALTITGDAKSDVLHRSIFDVNVYTATLALDGRFGTADISELDPAVVSVRWQDAIFALAVSDVAGLKQAATLSLNGRDGVPFQPSIGVPGARLSGIHAKLGRVLPGESPQAFRFNMTLHFTGSTSLSFAPAARETRVALTSDWPHPSFSGAFLPVERTVEADGFSAKWRVPHLARSVPEAWIITNGGIDQFQRYQFGVSLHQPVDFYALVMRAVKYGILFLAVGFMGVFVLETLSARRVHAVQYLFVGMAMVFFFVLLLSLSEHLGFALAYAIASAATGGMLAIYVGKALASVRSGVIMLGLFALLYGFLYLILQLEDYALLAGALLGFVALSTVMFATLKVDWSGLGAAATDGPAT